MRVGCCKQQRAECDAQKTAEITLEYTVNKKSNKKLLNHRRDCYRENDDHHALLDRARSAEKFDDVLLARATSEKPLRDGVGQQDQWIRKNSRIAPVPKVRAKLTLKNPPNAPTSNP